MMKNRINNVLHCQQIWIILLIGGFVLALYGCGGVAEQISTVSSPTILPNTETPLPSSTPTSPPTDTPEPTATPDKTATVAAAATEEMEAKMIKIAPKLEKLGFGLDSGQLIYTNSAVVSLTVDSYNEDKPKVILDKPVQDFILQADIGWNSTSGLAGCGIIFRAEEDLERGANDEYLMLRLSGAPAWDIEYFRYGQYQYSLLPSAQYTAAIDERQDAINTVTLIVQGDTIESIMNTTKGVDASDKKLTEGRIALLAWQESGKTTCTFRNVWVWELNPEAAVED